MSSDTPEDSGKMVTQLGSDPNHLAEGVFDERKVSVVPARLVLPLTYLDISGRYNYGHKLLHESLLAHYVGVGGRGRRDMIQGESVMKGAQPNTEAEIERPGLIARHVWARDKEAEWKEQHGLK